MAIAIDRLDAVMQHIDRAWFAPPEFKEVANVQDDAIPFGTGQTIPNRAVTRLMIALLELKESDKVLEIGFGSGYQAAIMAELCAEVVSVEIRPVSKSVCDSLPNNVIVYGETDGCKTWLKQSFDAIIVTAATPGVFAVWRSMLKEGGRLVAPIGERGQVQAIRKYQVMDGNMRDMGDYGYGNFVSAYLDGDYTIYKGIRARNV